MKGKKTTILFNWKTFMADHSLWERDIANIYGVKTTSAISAHMLESKISDKKKEILEKYLSTNLDKYVIKDQKAFLLKRL